MVQPHKGQSLLEYSVLLVVIVAALLTMQTHMKRAVQGRWKSAADQVGDQYDPAKTTGSVTYQTASNAQTDLYPVNGTYEGIEGYYTMRDDVSQSTESTSSTLTTDVTGGLTK